MAGRAAVPEVIWTRPERAGRGPKAAYSRGDIAAAAEQDRAASRALLQQLARDFPELAPR